MFLPIGDDIRHRTFPILPCILIAANFLVFAHQIRIIKAEEGNARKIERAVENHYYTWGLVPKDLKENGQVVGLLTYMFLHGGPMHLLGNMLVLWAFAVSLEAGLGSLTLLGFYLLWGLMGGLAHAAMDWSSDLPLVGASGAIAGLIGAYTILYGYDAKIHCLLWIGWRPINVKIPAIAFGLGWIGMQLLDASSDPEGVSGVAWFAHIGGFAAGAVTAWLVRNDTDRELCRDTSGNLAFKDTPEEKQRRAEKVAESATKKSVELEQLEAVEDNKCPYCQTSLAGATEISPGLWRCANAKCERLVYDVVTFA
jgi:membrane associated rhomboid family serine protease